MQVDEKRFDGFALNLEVVGEFRIGVTCCASHYPSLSWLTLKLPVGKI